MTFDRAHAKCQETNPDAFVARVESLYEFNKVEDLLEEAVSTKANPTQGEPFWYGAKFSGGGDTVFIFDGAPDVEPGTFGTSLNVFPFPRDFSQ